MDSTLRTLRAARLAQAIRTLPVSHRESYMIEAVDALNDPLTFDAMIRRMAGIVTR